MLNSIRLRLTIWYSLILLAALGVFGIASYVYTGEMLSQNLTLSLENETEWLKDILEGRLGIERGKSRNPRSQLLPPPSAQRDTVTESEGRNESEEDYTIWNKIYEHSLLNSKKQFVDVRDKRGRVFYKSFNLGEDTLPSPPGLREYVVKVINTTLGSERIRLAAMNTKFYEIRVAYPVEEINDVLRSLFSIFIILIPIVLAISVFGGYFLAKQSLRPVEEITRTARKITATSLRERIHVKNPNDEIGRLTETLNNMIGRLEASFEQVQQFSLDASHELRTPLTIMRGEIELALRGNNRGTSYKKTLVSLLEEVLRMTSIIEGLILLAKADSGNVKLEKKPTHLNALVSEIREDAEILAEQKKISVSISRLDEATVLGDAVRLRQLMLNLIDNAIKYTPQDGKITLSLALAHGKARFTVEDTGIGIPDSELKKIFDRFYRVDKSRSRLPDGLGLGLSISRWIAEAHGGSLIAESKVGSGSKFTIVLPALVDVQA